MFLGTTPVPADHRQTTAPLICVSENHSHSLSRLPRSAWRVHLWDDDAKYGLSISGVQAVN